MDGSGAAQWLKGQTTNVQPATHQWGGMEGLPDFVRVDVTDVGPEAVRDALRAEWRQVLDWEVVSQNAAQDGFRLLLWCANRRASDGLGDVTVAQIQTFLQNWKATNIISGNTSAGAPGVRFDVTVFNILTSNGFWTVDLAALGITFAELSYVQASGQHDIRMTHPAGVSHARALEQVADRATVLTDSAVNRTVDFRSTRADATAIFKTTLQDLNERLIRRTLSYFDAAAVDAAIAAGGTVTRSSTQVQAALRTARDD